MTTTAPPVARTSTRLHGLDTLRAAALGLGIFVHALAPFIPGEPWLVLDSSSTEAAEVGTYWIHLFRMVLFMLLAGYFGRMMLRRRGPGAYLKDRALRIGLPVVAFWPLAVLPLGLLAVLNFVLRDQAPQEELAGTVPSWAPDFVLWFTPGHLWFLVILLQCVVITVVVRAIAVRLLGSERSDQLSQRIGRVLSSPAGVVIVAVPYVVCLLLQGTVHGGIHEPATILPSVSALTSYLGAFLAGWFLHALPGALDRIRVQWPAQLAVAAVLSVTGYLLLEVPHAPLVAHAGVIALAGWTWAFAVIGLSLRFLSRESRLMRYLADASYWSYLLHLPIVLALGLAMADLAWPIPVKLLVNCVITALVLLLSYDLFVRSTWIGKWLNGRRHPRALSREGRIRPPARNAGPQ